jgi:hypothetical protein
MMCNQSCWLSNLLSCLSCGAEVSTAGRSMCAAVESGFADSSRPGTANRLLAGMRHNLDEQLSTVSQRIPSSCC